LSYLQSRKPRRTPRNARQLFFTCNSYFSHTIPVQPKHPEELP
jgi:hypothetical protein